MVLSTGHSNVLKFESQQTSRKFQTTSQTQLSDIYQNVLLSTEKRHDTVLMVDQSRTEESISHYIKAQVISKDQINFMVNGLR
jgi:hypothetical protein